jgi:hypothetical protein
MIELLKSGRVFAIVGSKHTGKTSLLINLVEEVKQSFTTNVVCYFYHEEYKKIGGVNHISSLNELEQIKNSFIFVDEFYELFDLDNRHNTQIVKCVLAQIEHNNNILVLCGLPDYFKKYIASQVNKWFLMSINYDEVVNGSSLASYINQLSGDFKGGTLLNVPQGFTLFNGVMIEYKYYKKYDKKINRENLFTKR